MVRSFRLRTGLINTEFNIKKKNSFGASTFSNCRVSGKKIIIFVVVVYLRNFRKRWRMAKKDAPRSPPGKSPSIAKFH